MNYEALNALVAKGVPSDSPKFRIVEYADGSFAIEFLDISRAHFGKEMICKYAECGNRFGTYDEALKEINSWKKKDELNKLRDKVVKVTPVT